MSERKARSSDLRYLLDLLSAVVNQDEIPRTQIPPLWDYIYKTADYHDVANVVYYAILGLESGSKKTWRKPFEDRFRDAVFSEERFSGAIKDIFNLFEERQIHCLIVSDYKMREFYPKKEMRFIKKVKLLVEKESLTQAMETLKYLDYEQKEEEEGIVLFYKIPGVTVQLVTEFSFLNKKIQKYFSEKLNHFTVEYKKYYIHKLTTEQFYLYLFSCAAEKFAIGELSIQDVLDIWCYYLQVYKLLDYNAVNKALEDLNIDTFHVYLVKLSAFWFGNMNFPEEDEVFRDMERYIFSKGIKGRALSAKILPLVEEVSQDYLNMLKAKRRKQAREWFFPPREYMEGMFKIVKKIPILLPFSWAVRLARIAGRYVIVRLERVRARIKWRYIRIKHKVHEWIEKLKPLKEKLKKRFEKLGKQMKKIKNRLNFKR